MIKLWKQDWQMRELDLYLDLIEFDGGWDVVAREAGGGIVSHITRYSSSGYVQRYTGVDERCQEAGLRLFDTCSCVGRKVEQVGEIPQPKGTTQ